MFLAKPRSQLHVFFSSVPFFPSSANYQSVYLHVFSSTITMQSPLSNPAHNQISSMQHLLFLADH